MFKILNRNREVVGLITSPINPIIEDNLTGMNELKFSVPATQEGLELEGYIRIENEHEYVIKEISTHGHNREVIAIMNVEELIGKVWTTFRSVDTYPTACIREIVAGTGWTVVDNCPPNKKRNLYGTQISSWDLIFLACDVWGIEVKFDTHNKVITTQEKGGTDRGTYFMSDLNLKQLMHDSHTHKLITRVIPIGKDGLTIEKVNGGKNYISNHSYSNKVITGIWQSDRYTKAQDLMDDAREYLAEMCVPYESYECKVSDLYRLEKNPNFEFNVGDVIYLIDNITKKKIQQRIIKHTKNLTAPDKDTINLANKSMSFTDYYKRLQLISNMTEQAIGSDGLISSGSIESVEADKITGEITASNVKTNTIVSEHIKADQILAGHIKADQIYGEHIVSDEIDTRHLKADSIKAEHISAGEIDADHISANSIQSGHISTGAIHAGHVQAGSINSNHIQTNTISSGHLQTGSVDAGHIKAGVIDSSHISTQSITSDHIQTNSIKAEHIQSGSIQSEHMQSSSIQAEHIQSGSIQTGHIQTGAITAGSGIIANGAIGSAQISSLDANKINAGEIDTSKVKIKGENGFLFIENNTLYVVDNNRKIRCELGVIENNSNYGFVVRGVDGQTIMLDHRGVHNAGITDGAIDNRKVSENANISGKKLDIDSVVKSINEDGSVTLQGTKVQIGNTTLDVKLSEQNNLITEQGQRLATQQSEITANTNAIKLKVDNQTYTADKNEMNTKLNKATSDISVMKGQIALKVEQTDIENAVDELEGTVDQKIKDAKAEIKVTTDSISQRVSSNESTTSTLSTKVTTIEGTANTANSNATNALNKANTATTTANSASTNATSALNKANSAIEKADDAKDTADTAIETAEGANTTAGNALSTANTASQKVVAVEKEVTSTKSKVATLETNLDSITQRVSSNETTTSTLTTTIETVKTTANNASTNASNALDKANTANTNASNAVTTANKANTTASTASTNATTALNTANNASNTASSASTKADNAVSTANTAKSTADKAQTTANSANTLANTANNTANTNKNNITTLQTTVTTTNNKVAELTTNLDGITQRVSSTESKLTTTTNKIDNLQIGGRNLILNSKKVIENSSYCIHTYAIADQTTMVQGDTYTISFDGKLTDSSQTGFYINVYPSPHPALITLNRKGNDSEYHHYTGTFTLPKNSSYTEIGVYTLPLGNYKLGGVKNVKVEKGNKATDYTPAPEDVDSSIASVDSKVQTTNNKVASIETNLNGITQRVSSTESTVSSHTTQLGTVDSRINNAKNSAISTASSDATTKANNALASAKTDATTKANNALADAKTYTNGQITTVNTTINNKVAEIKATTDAITQRVSSTETITNEMKGAVTNLKSGHGLAYAKDIIVYGDSNKYYPVYVKGGNQDLVRTIKIWRGFNEQGPNDWNTSTHRGGLLFTWQGNFGGWGGSTYKELILENESTYTTLLADCGIRVYSQWYVFFLRGGGSGGALYHFASDQVLDLQAYYNGSSDLIWSSGDYKQYADNYKTTVNTTRLNNLKLAKESSVTAVDAKVTTTNSKVATLETNLNGITQRVASTESTTSTLTTKVNTAQSTADSANNKINNLQVGGRNLIKQSVVRGNNVASSSYDKNTATWTLTANAGAGGTWGAGLVISGDSVRIPYGKTYVLSFEIKVPRACSWNLDVNNYAVTGSSWNGNDNDASSARATSSKSLVANQWIKCWSRISNTNSNNTNKVDIYDNSVFGVVMQNETSSMTYQIRNVQGEIGNIPSEYTPALEDVQSQIDTAQSTADSATTKANNAQATANTANSTANTANAQATTNKNNISSLTTTVSNTNSKVASLETNLNSITSRVSSVESTSNTTILLAKAMSNGKMVHTDPMFKKSANEVYIYNNSGNGTVTVNRISKVSGCPTTSTHCIEVKTTGTASPGNGGFYQAIHSRANAIFIQKFLAKVPSGLTLNVASNSMGDGYSDRWLTSNKGTGKWEEYIREVRCGSTGTFSMGGHVYVSGASPTTSSPLVWYVGMCTVYDITDSDERITDLTSRVSTAESKLTKDSLTTTIGSHYTTSTDVNNAITSKGYATTSQVQQTKNELTATFSESGGYNKIFDSYINTTSSTYGFATRSLDASKLVKGKTYTLSMNARKTSASNTGYPVVFLYNSGWSWSTSVSITSTTDTTQNVTFTLPTNIDVNTLYVTCYHYPSGSTGSSHVNWIQLTEGSVAQPWSPHPSETYQGITRIDKDGIQVSQSNISTTTKMNANGFYINKGGTDVFKVDSGGLKMTGNITGSTFSSANNIFQVLSDGTVETDDINVSGTVSTDTLTVNKISNPRYPEVLDKAMTVYIKSGASSPDDFYHGAVYGSFKDMLAVAPRNLQGYTLDIVMQSNITENVSLTWFTSGQVDISFQGYTLYGYLFCYGASMVYRLYGGLGDDAKMGKIMPSCGRKMGSYYYALVFQYCQFAVNNIGLYPDTTNTTNSGGICVNRGARGTIFSATAYGSMRYLVRSEYGSHVYVGKTSGTCNNATFCATTGSIISLNNDNPQAGRSTSGNPYWVGSGGMIVNNQLLGMANITFGTTANSGSNTNTSTGSSQTVTETITASLADTYRSTVYNNWKKDGTVRQGDWGYGNCTGLWFFDNKLSSALSKGTTKSVSIKITRQSGGNSGAVTHTLKVHNHATRPSGAPTMGSTITTFSLATGASTTLNLTSAQINTLKSGKGIGLQSSYSNSTYSVCSGTITIKVTYTT